jgi:hypothetical protein
MRGKRRDAKNFSSEELVVDFSKDESASSMSNSIKSVTQGLRAASDEVTASFWVFMSGIPNSEWC